MIVSDVIDKVIPELHVKYDKETLLRCFNIVETDMALNYFLLFAQETFDDVSEVKFSELKHNITSIIKVNCKYIETEYGIRAKGSDKINCIEYSYLPKTKGFYDTCEYKEDLLNCYISCIISEFFVMQGFYDEADLWQRRYKKYIKEFCDGHA